MSETSMGWIGVGTTLSVEDAKRLRDSDAETLAEKLGPIGCTLMWHGPYRWAVLVVTTTLLEVRDWEEPLAVPQAIEMQPGYSETLQVGLQIMGIDPRRSFGIVLGVRL